MPQQRLKYLNQCRVSKAMKNGIILNDMSKVLTDE